MCVCVHVCVLTLCLSVLSLCVSVCLLSLSLFLPLCLSLSPFAIGKTALALAQAAKFPDVVALLESHMQRQLE